MIDAEFYCAYCGEKNLIEVDPGGGLRQSYTEDCQVCCRPNRLHIQIDPDDPALPTVDAEAEMDLY